MTYLFIGADGQVKDAKIAELKNKYLSGKDELNFDYDVFYGPDLDPQTLKKSLLSLPAVAPRRFILIHVAHKLNSPQLALIIAFAEKEQKHAVLVLESTEWNAKTELVRKLKAKAKVVELEQHKEQNVFDVTDLMTARRPADALQVLADIQEQGTHPLQILGGLIWFWGRQRNRIAPGKFENGLRILQQADLNIKRSRLEPSYAVELAVVKLCALLSGLPAEE
jgi:DNA polymerase III delta subunit